MVNNSSTKAWSTTSRDTATNKSSYFKKRRRSSGCSSCRPKRKSVSGEGLSRTFFSLRRRRGFSPRHPAPVTIEDAGLVSGPGVGSALFHLSSCIFISSDNATQFLKPAKPCGCTVSIMDLSEAHGLVLFRVVREGIGITQRLSATGTGAPTGVWDAHPRTRASQEPTGHHRQRSPEMERALHPRR